MKRNIFYGCYDIFLNPANSKKLETIPGGKKFADVLHVFGTNITLFDRTNSIVCPLKTSLMDNMVLPKLQPIEKSYDQICDDRANELFNHAINTNRKIAIMYSGGIDSTAILCSFIRTRTPEELKKHFVVLLSHVSIEENKKFADKFVFRLFNCVSSFRFPHFIGNNNYLVITGENADQLFGSQINDYFAAKSSYGELFKPLDQMEGKILDWFSTQLDGDYKRAEFVLSKLKKVVSNSEVSIDNTYKFFWWINFTTKWQSVYVRVLPFSRKIDTIRIDENYTTFYNTKDFQLWSMNNTNSFVKETQDTCKYPSKQYIYSVTNDTEYNKKLKIGSLWRIVLNKELPYALHLSEDNQLICSNKYPTEEDFNFDNDFIG